jgi:hypothetical protein
MSTTKRISGNYTIQTLNPNDQINLQANAVIINGNLFVTGNSQTVSTTNSAISDNLITLNHGLSNSAPPNPLGAAIEVDRGTQANVQIRWNETLQAWQASNDGVTYKYILLGAGTTANLYNDPAPTLGANLNLNGHTIYSPAGSVQLFANTAQSGGSGLYVTNTQATGAELVTKSKAVAFSIIFG